MKSIKMIFPCKIDWETMPKQEAGKYCKECKKKINDYTASGLDNVKPGIFCGRFNSEQLSYHKSEYEVRNFKTLSLSLLTLLGGAQGYDLAAQTNAANEVPGDSVNKELYKSKFSNLRFPLKMEGTIRDKVSKEVIVNADVRMLQHDSVIYSVKTDSSGKFSFILLEKDTRDAFFDLRVSYAATNRPYRADTLLKVPLISGAIKRNVVFSIDFLLTPLVIPAITVDQIKMPFDDGVQLSGVVAYDFQKPAIDFKNIGIYTVMPVMTKTLEAGTATESHKPLIADGSATSLKPSPEEKKKQIKMEKPWAVRTWIVLTGLVIALLIGVNRFRNKNK